MSGRVRRRSTGIPSGSSSCPRACSSRCRERTGHWRSAITSAAGALPRLTGPSGTNSMGSATARGQGRGTLPPAPHGTFRRTWPGRAQMMSWRPTGTRSASRRSRPTARGCDHLSSAPSMRCWATGRPSVRSRRRWSCRRVQARPRRCLPCWWPPGCRGCWYLFLRMCCVTRLRGSSRRWAYCKSSAS